MGSRCREDIDVVLHDKHEGPCETCTNALEAGGMLVEGP